MTKFLKTTLFSALCLVLLASCGKDEEDSQEAASLGQVLDQQTQQMGQESDECPDNYEPVCTDTNVTYKNACHAEMAGEDGWQPGEC